MKWLILLSLFICFSCTDNSTNSTQVNNITKSDLLGLWNWVDAPTGYSGTYFFGESEGNSISQTVVEESGPPPSEITSQKIAYYTIARYDSFSVTMDTAYLYSDGFTSKINIKWADSDTLIIDEFKIPPFPKKLLKISLYVLNKLG